MRSGGIDFEARQPVVRIVHAALGAAVRHQPEPALEPERLGECEPRRHVRIEIRDAGRKGNADDAVVQEPQHAAAGSAHQPVHAGQAVVDRPVQHLDDPPGPVEKDDAEIIQRRRKETAVDGAQVVDSGAAGKKAPGRERQGPPAVHDPHPVIDSAHERPPVAVGRGACDRLVHQEPGRQILGMKGASLQSADPSRDRFRQVEGIPHDEYGRSRLAHDTGRDPGMPGYDGSSSPPPKPFAAQCRYSQGSRVSGA